MRTFILQPVLVALFTALSGLGAIAARGEPAPTIVLEGGFGPCVADVDAAGRRSPRPDVPLWDSWQHDDAKTGRLRYGPFRLGRNFAVHVLGYTKDRGTILGWEDAATGARRLLLPRHEPGPRWVLCRWVVPDDWRGREVFFFAEDSSVETFGWLGVSGPVEAGVRAGQPLQLVAWHSMIFVLLLLPGAGAVAWIARRRELSPERALALMLVLSATAACPLFYLHYFHATAGRWTSVALLAGGALAFAVGSRPGGRTVPWRSLAPPLLVCHAASLLYLAVLFAYGGFESPEMVALDRFLVRLPPDNVLPFWVGDLLAAGRPPRGFLGDWLSSDRPPLQSCLYLLIHPVAGHGLGYQIMATILQCWVFAGMWILLRCARVPARATAWVLFVAVFSGFFLFNSTFAWPKLLPAAFLLIAAAALFARRPADGWLAGAAAGLAMLGHGGSAFGLLGIGAVSLLRPPVRRWRVWGAAVVAGALYVAPWTLYQKFVDPPGNRLLKWHLAGAMAADPRPLGQTLREAYAAKSVGELLRDRWTNFVMLAHRDETPALGGLRNAVESARAFGIGTGLRNAVYHLRELCFFHLLHAPQAALLGAAGWLLLGLRPRNGTEPARRLVGTMLALVAATSAAWCLLMFVPGSTGNHQGSYFNNAALFVALGLGLAALPRAAAIAVAALHLAVLALVWVHAFPHSHHTPAVLPAADPAMFALMLAAAPAALASIAWIARQPDPPPGDTA